MVRLPLGARAYGARVGRVLGGAERLDDLGPEIAPGLHQAELEYLVREEWARAADDVLWRRSKLGLHYTEAQRMAVVQWFAEREHLWAKPPAAAA